MSPVSIHDVVDTFVTALRDTETIGKTYELGGPEVVSFRQVMEIVLAETGRKRILAPAPLALMRPFAAIAEMRKVKQLEKERAEWALLL